MNKLPPVPPVTCAHCGQDRRMTPQEASLYRKVGSLGPKIRYCGHACYHAARSGKPVSHQPAPKAAAKPKANGSSGTLVCRGCRVGVPSHSFRRNAEGPRHELHCPMCNRLISRPTHAAAIAAWNQSPDHQIHNPQ